MKNGKRRKEEIKFKRIQRVSKFNSLEKLSITAAIRLGAVPVDRTQLLHDSSLCTVPDFYTDRAFICRDCGSDEIWTAKQQKWWYEIAKGLIISRAVRCRSCRNIERSRVDEARQVSREGMALKLALKN